MLELPLAATQTDFPFALKSPWRAPLGCLELRAKAEVLRRLGASQSSAFGGVVEKTVVGWRALDGAPSFSAGLWRMRSRPRSQTAGEHGCGGWSVW